MTPVTDPTAAAHLDTDVDVAAVAARFGHVLHRAGVPAAPDRSARFAAAMTVTRPATIDELYWTARVTMVGDESQVETFDRVFGQVFRGLADPADWRGASEVPPPPHTTPGPPLPSPGRHAPGGGEPDPRPTAGDASAEGGDDAGRETVLAAMSSQERLRHADFATLSEDELVQLRALMAQLAIVLPIRPSRRTVVHQRGGRVDLRASLRRAHRTGGDPMELVTRRRRTRTRRLVVLCDISGSMEAYSRAYVQLLHSAVGGAKAEAFVFATRLSRITRPLRTSNPDLALRRASAAAPDWSGGTRIGAALQSFNDRFGRRGVGRGAVVVIVSDGWERDDPALLGREVARLARLAHRVIWVNPRAASPRYEPLVGGMAVALPFVDALVSGHSLAAIDELLTAIAGGTTGE